MLGVPETIVFVKKKPVLTNIENWNNIFYNYIEKAKNGKSTTILNTREGVSSAESIPNIN